MNPNLLDESSSPLSTLYSDSSLRSPMTSSLDVLSTVATLLQNKQIGNDDDGDRGNMVDTMATNVITTKELPTTTKLYSQQQPPLHQHSHPAYRHKSKTRSPTASPRTSPLRSPSRSNMTSSDMSTKVDDVKSTTVTDRPSLPKRMEEDIPSGLTSVTTAPSRVPHLTVVAGQPVPSRTTSLSLCVATDAGTQTSFSGFFDNLSSSYKSYTNVSPIGPPPPYKHYTPAPQGFSGYNSAPHRQSAVLDIRHQVNPCEDTPLNLTNKPVQILSNIATNNKSTDTNSGDNTHNPDSDSTSADHCDPAIEEHFRRSLGPHYSLASMSPKTSPKSSPKPSIKSSPPPSPISSLPNYLTNGVIYVPSKDQQRLTISGPTLKTSIKPPTTLPSTLPSPPVVNHSVVQNEALVHLLTASHVKLPQTVPLTTSAQSSSSLSHQSSPLHTKTTDKDLAKNGTVCKLEPHPIVIVPQTAASALPPPPAYSSVAGKRFQSVDIPMLDINHVNVKSHQSDDKISCVKPFVASSKEVKPSVKTPSTSSVNKNVLPIKKQPHRIVPSPHASWNEDEIPPKVVLINSTTPTTITGSIDDHFAKSLGDSWRQLKSSDPSLTPPSSPMDKSVEDHFAKALGPLWNKMNSK